MDLALPADNPNPVQLRTAVCHQLEVLGEWEDLVVVVVQELVQVSLVDDVLCPDLPRAQLPGSDPAPDRLRVSPGALRGLGTVINVVAYLLHRPWVGGR